MNFSLKRIHSDIKSIFREPVMILLMMVPAFVLIVFKIAIPIFTRVLQNKVGFDLSSYYIYFLVIMLVMTPQVLGTLTGFMMLDEKDWHISSLMLVTPSGLFGYLLGRLIIPLILTILYSMATFIFFDIYTISINTMLTISALLLIQTYIFTVLLFSLAEDKVQGLTYAKGLGILMFPVFFSLFNNPILDVVAYVSPFYWVFEIMKSHDLVTIVLGVFVHIIWFVVPSITGIKKIYS